MILIYVFAVKLELFPAALKYTPGADYSSTLDEWWDIAQHAFLPIMTLMLGLLAQYSLVMRASLTNVLTEDFIVTARAIGNTRRRVLRRHAGAERAAARGDGHRAEPRLHRRRRHRDRGPLLLARHRHAHHTRASRTRTTRCCRASSCSRRRSSSSSTCSWTSSTPTSTRGCASDEPPRPARRARPAHRRRRGRRRHRRRPRHARPRRRRARQGAGPDAALERRHHRPRDPALLHGHRGHRAVDRAGGPELGGGVLQRHPRGRRQLRAPAGHRRQRPRRALAAHPRHADLDAGRLLRPRSCPSSSAPSSASPPATSAAGPIAC